MEVLSKGLHCFHHTVTNWLVGSIHVGTESAALVVMVVL